jgi:hypothetical protein
MTRAAWSALAEFYPFLTMIWCPSNFHMIRSDFPEFRSFVKASAGIATISCAGCIVTPLRLEIKYNLWSAWHGPEQQTREAIAQWGKKLRGPLQRSVMDTDNFVHGGHTSACQRRAQDCWSSVRSAKRSSPAVELTNTLLHAYIPC